MKNTLVFVIGTAVAGWALHDLLAPGEAQSTGMMVVNVIVFVSGCMTAIGAIILMKRGNLGASDS